jgi:hypothetical protein
MFESGKDQIKNSRKDRKDRKGRNGQAQPSEQMLSPQLRVRMDLTLAILAILARDLPDWLSLDQALI